MMNKDNSNKAKAGSKSKEAMKAILEYLTTVGAIQDYKSQKYGYSGKKRNQFRCDYLLTLSNNRKWILYTPASLSTDRLKTKQWDAFHIKKIDSTVEKAYIVCPNTIVSRKTQKAYLNMRRYNEYIQNGDWESAIDGILLQSELVEIIEDESLGTKVSGKRAAKKGLNFEIQLKGIMSNQQNLDRWKGDDLAAGWQYNIFLDVVSKLGINPSTVDSIYGDTDIAGLPNYTYKDGTTKKGGNPKTDLVVVVNFSDNTTKEYTFSCKSSYKKMVTVHQFPPKYAVEILNIKESDAQQLLEDYVKAGGPKVFEEKEPDKAKKLADRLLTYRDELSQWALRGSDKDGSDKRQRPDYIITRYISNKEGDEPSITIETIDECIKRQREMKKGHFNTDFSWTITSKDKEGNRCPVLRINID